MVKHSSSLPKLKSLFNRSSQILLLSSLILLAILFFFSPLIRLFGSDMAPAIPALRILSLTLPLFFLTAIFQWTLITLHQEILLIKIYSLGLIFNAATNILVIPRWGFLAAAITTGLTELVILILLLSPVLKSFQYDS